MKVREPVARPLDVVVVELLLSASQAYLVGVLMYLAVGIWDDRGVGTGPVAVILALLALGVGAAWLYWLLGGTGWPLAAVGVPAGIFLGFALVLSWRGADLLRVEGLPTLVATAAAILGVVCGVFLDSPRRWRWDQRQRPRPGTRVPRVSPTTRAVAGRIPRSLPRRSEAQRRAPLWGSVDASVPRSERQTVRIDLEAPPSGGNGRPAVPEPANAPTAATSRAAATAPGAASTRAPGDAETTQDASVAARSGASAARPTVPAARQPTARASLEGGTSSRGTTVPGAVSPGTTSSGVAPPGRPSSSHPATAPSSTRRPPPVPRPAPDRNVGPIELPTSIEPRAQRSPWAWAAPPEWNRDEDDERTPGGTKRT